MRNFITLLALFSLGFTCCNRSQKKIIDHGHLNQNISPKKDDHVMVNFDNPVFISNSEYIMFPLLNETDDKDHEIIFKSSGGRSASYWNIVFYNSATKQYHLLDEKRKMIITNYEQRNLSSGSFDEDVAPNDNDQSYNLIFYSAIITDFNNDGKLNKEDPEYLFISDKAGNNFKQISPDNLMVRSWRVIKKTGKVLIQTVRDVNNDKKFDNEDQTVPYIYDIKTGAKAEPIFSDEFKTHLSKLFETHWPVEK
jgi:hypothetical protein